MSTPSSKSKSSKSGTPSSKDKKASGSSETKSSSQSKTKSTTPTKTKEESLSESSDSDEDFAVHVVREPRNTAVLDVAATIEQKRNEGAFDDPNDMSLDSSSSEVSEDDDAVMAGAIADDFLSVLSKIHSKHPDVYDKEKKHFPDEIEVVKDSSKQKKLTYKEMERQLIMDRVAKGDDAGSDLDDEEELAEREKTTKSLSYAEEQALAKKEMLAAAWGSGSEDEADDKEPSDEHLDEAGLIKKKRTKADQEQFENEYQAFLRTHAEPPTASKKESKSKREGSLLSFWTKKDIDEDDAFLRDFVLNKRWMGTATTDTKGKAATMDVDDDEDTKQLEKQDDFETAYNFRFEDPNGAQLVTHARSQESVRVEKNKRAEKRARKRERQRLAKQAAEEEKIEEKKKRKADILQRVQELAAASGLTDGVKKLVKDEEEWDPDAHEEAMESAFGEDYYAQGEKEKPTISEDADILDVEAWLRKVKESSKTATKAGADGKGKKKKKEEENENVDEIEKALEDYYNLDFEDDIAGDRTRFRYTQVAPQTYGLSNEDLLNMSDSELDQLIPMKKIATYREDGGFVKSQKLKYKKKLMMQQRGEMKRQHKKSSDSKSSSKSSQPTPSESSSSKKRRRDSIETSDVVETKPSSKKSKSKESAAEAAGSE